jgi:two-component system, OmpR family, sensor histidine kinase BaeS
MTTTPACPSYPRPHTTKPFLESTFGAFWPDTVPGRPRLLSGALAVGLFAAVVVPYRDQGIGMFAVFAAVVAVVVASHRRLRAPRQLAAVGLCLLLGSIVVLRDADWIVALCVLAGVAVASAVLVDVRSFTSLAVASVAVPLAALRDIPWLARSIQPGRASTHSWAVIRTVVMSVGLAWVFGALFASADALFSEWVDAVIPDWSVASAVARFWVLVGVAGATLAFAYVGINPPRHPTPSALKPVTRTFEWLLPVAVVVAIFATFVLAQLTVMFGGHGYLARTTGITYADYVHQGFGQMTVATVLTLGVVAAAVAKAPRATPHERQVLRAVLGLLCAFALVVVASAIYRMHVYEQAYGFTRLRLLVTFFEAWLGLLLGLVLVAGIRLRGVWVPMATVVTGAVTLLALAWLNPDAYIASQNVQRFEQTGKIDVSYLGSLSGDAAPALSGLPRNVMPCPVASTTDDDWLAWNLGRQRAAHSRQTKLACPAS